MKNSQHLLDILFGWDYLSTDEREAKWFRVFQVARIVGYNALLVCVFVAIWP